jgi:tetratricopeptide (TPR) repeat protein
MMAMYRMSDAQTQMARALELKPKQAEFLQRMARVMLELDSPAAAATYLKSAPARQLETRLLQGRLHYARRRFSKAVEHLKRVLAEAPKQVEAQIYIALANARRKRTDEAVRQLQRTAAANPKDHRVYVALATVRLRTNELDKCHASLKKAWAITKLDPRIPTIAGHMYLKKHDIATAAKRFARAIKAQPDYRPAHLGLARTFVLTGDVNAARAELKKIPSPQQKQYDVYAMSVWIELAAGNTSAAHAAAAQAEAAGAPKGLVARLAGAVALAQRKGAEAVELLQKAVRSMGRDAMLTTLLAKAQTLAGRVDDAYDSYNLALRADPGYPEALVGLSRIAIRDREYFIAIKRINDALKKIAERGRPQSMKAEAHTVLGLAYLRQGDTGRAITNLQDAMDLDPNLAEPHDLMGQTYDKLDRPQRAIAFYDKALKLDGTLKDAYYRLGRAYAKSGDAASAVRYYQDYLNRNPPQAKAQEVTREIQRLQQQ